MALSGAREDWKVGVVRAALHTELIGDVARMGRLATQIMINSSAALLQADLTLAELVIARGDEMDARHRDVDQRCIALIARQAPVITDLPTVVAMWQVAADLQRMGTLAQHIAKVARLAHPNLAVPDDVRPVVARMSLLTIGLAQHTATAIEQLDPLAGDRLARAADEVDALLRQLFHSLFAENWAHGMEPAVCAALVSRYYELFADHAVAAARQVGCLATGRIASRRPATLPQTASVV